MTVYHSFNGGMWTAISVSDTSIVALELGKLPYGSIYDDGYGHRYCLASLAD